MAAVDGTLLMRALSVTLLCSLLCAQLEAASYISTYGRDDGLPQVLIYDIVEDRQGYLLIGTQGGLAKFDGHNFQVIEYDSNGAGGLAGSRVKRFLTSPDGSIWIATSGGLNRYRGQIDQIERIDADFDHHVTDLAWVNDTLWLSTLNNGLYRLEESQLQQVSAAPSDIVALQWDQAKQLLWMASSEGLNAIKPSMPETRIDYLHAASEAALKGNKFESLYLDRHRRLWIGYARSGFSVVDLNTLSVSNHLDHSIGAEATRALNDDAIYAFHQDKYDRVWIGGYGDGGLLRWDSRRNELRHYFAPDQRTGLTNDQILCIYEDFSGSIWVGTANGLNRIDPYKEAFGHIPYAPDTGGLNKPSVTAVFEDKAGHLWFGSQGGGLQQLNDQTGLLVAHPPVGAPQLPNRDVIALAPAADGIWVGTTNGLFLYLPTQGLFLTFEAKQGLKSNLISDLRQDATGTLWLHLSDAEEEKEIVQVYLADSNRFCNPLPAHLAKIDVAALFPDGGGMWLVSRDGTTYLLSPPNKSCQSTAAAVRLPIQEPFIPLSIDTKGNIWIVIGSHQDRGLGRISADLLHLNRFDRDNGLPNNVVRAALEDQQGNIWISTDNGLAKLLPNSEAITTVYGKANGLQSDEFAAEAFLQRANGQLVFGGINGANVFYPNEIQPNLIPPRIHITSLQALHQTGEETLSKSQVTAAIERGDTIELDPEQQGLVIEATVLHYSNPTGNLLRYRWNAGPWTETIPGRLVLPLPDPGNHKLHILALNADGVWSKHPATLNIYIPETWWRSTLIYAVVGLLAVIVLIQFRSVMLRRRNIELEAQVRQRTKAIEEFFENISHEFRTPLTLVLGPLKRLAKGPLKDKLRTPIENASKLLSLITQLLDLSRLKSGKLPLNLRVRNLSDEVRTAAKHFATTLRAHDLEFGVDIEDNLICHYDPPKIETIVSNLLSNAIKYTPAMGKITLTCRRINERKIIICVSDTGCGIAKENLDRIFYRFQRVDTQASQGSGIGLAYAQELAKLHAGKIEVQSDLGVGSEFTVHLPLLPRQAHQLEAPPAHQSKETTTGLQVDALSRGKPSPTPKLEAHNSAPIVLVVDDEPGMRTYLREVLPDYHVLEAEDGEKGFELAKARIPDIIISDVMMPKMDGIEFARLLRADELTHHIPIILLTAKGGRDSRLAGLREGVDDYIAKPFDEHEFLQRVRNQIARNKELARIYGAQLNQDKPPTPQRELNPLIDKLNASLKKNYSDPHFKERQLAEQVPCSERQLQRILKNSIGQTPNAFLRSFRLDQAATMLRSTDQPIALVAEACGFTSDPHFSRAFKAKFKCSPSQYRKG